MLIEVIKNKKPVTFIGHKILLNWYNELYLYDISEEKNIHLNYLPFKTHLKILGKIKLLKRLFRLGVNSGIYGLNKVFLSYSKKIFCVDLANNSIIEEYSLERGKGPLHFSIIENIKGFEDGLYFGEYFGNPLKEPVRIIKRSLSGEYSVIYTFPYGKINHVHNIIPDQINKCVWVLTGDFGDAAAIWRTTDNFKTLEPILIGAQQFRASIAFPTEKGLLYGTDTQFEANNIRLLFKAKNEWISKSLSSVNGSVIYGCKVADYFVFSTSTEPVRIRNNFFLKWFEWKRGPGILKNESHVLVGKIDQGFKILFSKRKDFLPYRLFQFGTIFFPAGINPTNKLFSYSIGNYGNDLDTEVHILKKSNPHIEEKENNI